MCVPRPTRGRHAAPPTVARRASASVAAACATSFSARFPASRASAPREHTVSRVLLQLACAPRVWCIGRGNVDLAKRDRSIWPPLTRARYTYTTTPCEESFINLKSLPKFSSPFSPGRRGGATAQSARLVHIPGQCWCPRVQREHWIVSVKGWFHQAPS